MLVNMTEITFLIFTNIYSHVNGIKMDKIWYFDTSKYGTL